MADGCKECLNKAWDMIKAFFVFTSHKLYLQVAQVVKLLSEYLQIGVSSLLSKRLHTRTVSASRVSCDYY